MFGGVGLAVFDGVLVLSSSPLIFLFCYFFLLLLCDLVLGMLFVFHSSMVGIVQGTSYQRDYDNKHPTEWWENTGFLHDLWCLDSLGQ